MVLYKIHEKQKLPITVEQAWEFLSNPSNLSRITPKHMQFEMISTPKKQISPGQILQYRVSPFLGIKLKWVSEITHVQKNHFFVDKQLYGPYSVWIHKHFIHKIENGVILEDEIHYSPPFGVLGEIMHKLWIKKQLTGIFDYRKEKLNKLFGVYDVAVKA